MTRLVPSGWTNGHSSENQPRLIHCVHVNIILVSRVYRCENDHRVLAHHPSLIKLFTAGHLRCLLPFYLWHRTGFTIPLLEYITDLVDSGVSLRHIESTLTENRLRLFHKLKQKFLILQGSGSQTFPDYDSDSIHYWKSSLKYHAVSAFYLMHFWQWEHIYHNRMSQTSLPPPSPWLSCDHTFRSVRNIGIVRHADDSWIKQYKGLFCVLNSVGQVVTWKMTKGLAVDDVEDILHRLQNRLQVQGVQLEEFYVDNCCSLRRKLQAIFGQQLKVFLDVFHALQRVTKKIPKRHPYHTECLQSLRLVFRNPADQGDCRTMATPSALQLKSQLLAFKSKWKDISHNGKHVLPPAATNEIQSLLVHIHNGCLSGIAPGRGTNQNERLHRNLDSHMASCKYGPEFAYALLTSAFFRHNEKIGAGIDKRHAEPIAAYGGSDINDDTETFGLATVNRGEIELDTPLQTQSHKVQMKELKYHQVQELFGEMQLDTHQDDEQATLIPEFTTHDVLHLLLQTVSSYYVSLALQDMSMTAVFNSKDIYFTSFLALVQGLGKEEMGNDSELDMLLKSWNFRRVEVRGDGSCLFTSVAHSLIQRIETGDASILQILLQTGVPEQHLKDPEYIVRLLRVRMVQEWNNNIEYYQGFLTDDLTAISHQFLDSSQFSGNAGDLMAFPIANVLQLPITIFTSAQNMPIICILPTTTSLISTKPLCLAYTQDNDQRPGHYEYVVQLDSPSIPQDKKKKILKCACGRKTGSSATACSGPRCPCFREKTGCSKTCTCKNCGNQCGKRPSASTTRRRQAYDEQRHPLRGKPGREVMSEIGEQSVIGHLTLLEILLLKSIVIYCIIQGIESSPENVYHMYARSCDLTSECTSIQFPLYPRDINVVRRFLTKIFHSVNLLMKLFN